MQVDLFYITFWLFRFWYTLKPYFEALYPSFVLYYVVKPDGRQYPLFFWPTRLAPNDLFLVVSYKNGRKKLRFSEDANDLKCVAPNHTIIGLNVTLGEKDIILDPYCFMLVGNVLFSPVFNLWLSRQYGVEPTKIIKYTYIDCRAGIHASTRPMHVLETGVQLH
jgi:hypothetical protein